MRVLFRDGSNGSIVQTIDELNQFASVDCGGVDDFIQLFAVQIIESCRDMDQSLMKRKREREKRNGKNKCGMLIWQGTSSSYY